MFICKASARVLHVYVIIACNLKRKFMWHNSVEYWVCYSMLCCDRTKVFPRVVWPIMSGWGHYDIVSELSKASEECHFPACGWQGNATNWYHGRGMLHLGSEFVHSYYTPTRVVNILKLLLEL
jgi:hypothetical protein